MARPSHLTLIKGFPEPWVESLLDKAMAGPDSPLVLAIAGLQGSGKSTLARQMVVAAGRRGVLAVALSIDDFYLGRRNRLALASSVHPLLANRGPPGSHDVALACAVLDGLASARPGASVAIPRFDKLLDRRLPPSRWTQVREKPALIVLEGWFLGVPPEATKALLTPVNHLERNEDTDGRWRGYCNEALSGYRSLWQRLDRLWFLRGPGFEVVPRWRWQQEQQMQSDRPGCRGMSQSDVERFVMLFERISRHALRTLPALADQVIEIDAERRPLNL